jgi:cell division protein FtsI (penicillin-binding protein 3)
VVIQNTRKSKKIYGADVSGRVFKAISDKIYSHCLSKPVNKLNAVVDSSVYNYVGVKSDLESIFSKLNIPFTDSMKEQGSWRNSMYKANNAVMLYPAQLTTSVNIMPDVKGMGLKDAIYLLENKGLTTVASGKGKVVTQSIPAGTNFTKGQKVLIMLN